MIGSAASERASQASPVEGSTDYVLTDRPSESRFRRATHYARVGPGKISTGDQGVGRLRAGLIRPQRFALPLARLAVLTLDRDRRNQAHAVADSVARPAFRLICRRSGRPDDPSGYVLRH